VKLVMRVLLAAAIGSVWGLVELFVRPSGPYALAAAMAGAAWFAAIALVAEFVRLTPRNAMLAGAAAGVVAGALWSHLSNSTLPTLVSCILGAILGAVAARFG
jgi:prepilin signal peptidase PulO-like enzyme (type II secretory pathway)